MYANLVVRADGEAQRLIRDEVEFDSFRDYVARVRGELELLVSNAESPGRRRGVRLISTASRGYDSTAVTAFATRLGRHVVSYSAARSNTRIPRLAARWVDSDVFDDDGSEISRKLGAEPRTLVSGLDGLTAEMESWMLASGLVSPEVIFWSIFRDAEASDALTLWFAGHNGDALWDTKPRARAMLGDLYRGSPSGYALAEARLRYGVLDCSVPYLFATSIASVHRITMSPEMAPWRLGNDYDRPIPRRLLEEAGVERAAFGFGKKAVAQDFDSPQGAELRREFFATSAWTRLGERCYRSVALGGYLGARAALYVRARGARGRAAKAQSSATKDWLHERLPALDLRRQTFLFSVERLTREVQPMLPKHPRVEAPRSVLRRRGAPNGAPEGAAEPELGGAGLGAPSHALLTTKS